MIGQIEDRYGRVHAENLASVITGGNRLLLQRSRMVVDRGAVPCASGAEGPYSAAIFFFDDLLLAGRATAPIAGATVSHSPMVTTIEVT